MQKVIFIAIDQGFSARYLLRTDIFKELKNSENTIVILTPNADESYFIEEFRHENVFIENYKIDRYFQFQQSSKFAKLILTARRYAYKKKHHVNFSWYWHKKDKEQRVIKSLTDGLNYFALDALVYLLSHSSLCRKLLFLFERIFLTPDIHQKLFEKYRPDLLITVSLGNLSFDHLIMREATKFGTKILAVILSWDNPTTKGLAGAKADYAIAWTQEMKQELINHHDFPADAIFVSGSALYDIYYNPGKLLSKDEIFKKFGLHPDRKLLFFCLMSPTQFPWNQQLVEMLAALVENDNFALPCQLLLRLHPIYFRLNNGNYKFEKELNELKFLDNRYTHVHFDYPEVLSEKVSYDMPASEMIKLGSTLKYTDLLLCFFSSMMIEGSIFDKGIINIGLFEKNKIPHNILIKHNHISRVLSTEGVRVAFSKTELINHINSYLKDSSLDTENANSL